MTALHFLAGLVLAAISAREARRTAAQERGAGTVAWLAAMVLGVAAGVGR